VLFAAFVDRLEARVEALRAGFFDLATWAARQATTGRLVVLDEETSPLLALGVDAATGGLVVDDPTAVRGERIVHAGEVLRARVAGEGV
jgi:hypothetical protein